MTNRFTEEDIVKTIQKMDITPSPEWKQKTLVHLREIAEDDDVSTSEKSSRKINLFSMIFGMRFASSFVVAILIVAAGIFTYNLSTPLNKFQRHLAKANEALEQLRDYTQGKSIVLESQVAILPVVYAEDTTVETESAVKGLVETVTKETKKAIEVAYEIKDSQQSTIAFEAIDSLQDESVEVFELITQKVTNQEISRFVDSTIKYTQEQNIEIEKKINRFIEPDLIEEVENEPTEEVDTKQDTPGYVPKPPAYTPPVKYSPPSGYKEPEIVEVAPDPTQNPTPNPTPTGEILDEHGYTYR
ncbi:MAG: hypothetical protein O3B47_00300 [bacterium]|nr:hypothetical protein [bacterium]